MMSIEQTLERIAAGIEKLIEMQGGATVAPNPAPVAAPMPGPSGTGPGQTLPGPAPVPVTAAASPPAPPAVGGPPVGGPPTLAAVPTTAPGPQAAAVPTAPPAQAPVADTGLLDQIREAANSFHRAHPERAGEVWQILSAVGAQKIDAIPPQSQQQVLDQIRKLGA